MPVLNPTNTIKPFWKLLLLLSHYKTGDTGIVNEWRAPQASERDASVMARLFPTVLHQTELQRLNQSTEEFAAYWQEHGTGKNTSGSSQIMLGHWRRSSPHVKIILDTCLLRDRFPVISVQLAATSP
ncbi:hypothetical protein QOT17_023790 [Balamuthia mandrillaris]